MIRIMSFKWVVTLIVLLASCRPAPAINLPAATPALPTPTYLDLLSPTATPLSIPTNGDFELNGDIAQRAAEGKPLVIRVSYHDISNEFAPFIRRGVVRAVEDFKANVDLIGPVGPNAAVQIGELEQLLEIGVDGLAISSVNSEELAPIINRYLEQGIPVVTFNSDNPVSNRLAFVGQNLEESGYQAAKILADAMEGQGRVMITTIDAKADWSILREAGAHRALAEYPTIEVMPTTHTGTEPLEIYMSIEEAMRQHQDINGILGLDCCSFPPAGEYVKRNQLIGPVKIVGFDELPLTLDLIESGVILASISQDPERQSYEAVRMLIQFINGDVDSLIDIDTGIAVIKADNVRDFVSK